MPEATHKPVINAMSIDVEDYFQVSGFEHVIRRSDWDTIPTRFHIGMEKILTILAENKVRATFFFLGWIAERYPEWVSRVAEAGHEIALHGHDHQLVYTLTPETFEQDILTALAAIRKSYDGPVVGYRAPSFSIRHDSMWALDVLKKHGFTYDSSISLLKRKRSGMEGINPAPHQIIEGLTEFPPSTVTVLGKAIPVAGGGYFRLFPYWLTRNAIHHINHQHHRPAMVYLHPWELDPEQPRVKADAGNTFRHWVNLHHTEARLKQLCKDFQFAPIREVLAQ